jgi:chloride channel 7
MATIFLSSRENSILSLVEHPHAFSMYSLVTIAVSFFMLMILSFGVAVPAGIFMPTIVVGCTFGAVFGRCAKYVSCLASDLIDDGEMSCMQHSPFEPSVHGHGGMRIDDPEYAQYLTKTIAHAGPYALLGAVGLLGGIQRSSVSLVVIIVEGTGKIDYLLPIIFTTVCAKWVGDHLNDGIYHTAMHVKKIPFLENEPTHALKHKAARDIMCPHPICVKTEMKVRDVRQLLQTPGQRCNGFPVVKEVLVGHHAVQVYQGIILLQNLGVLLKRQRFWGKNEQDGRLERVKSGPVHGKDEVRTEIVDRTRTSVSSDQSGPVADRARGFPSLIQDSGVPKDDAGTMTGGVGMEMTLLPSPATRGTVSEMDHAKHRSNHDGLIDEALANLEPAQEDLYLNIAEAMNRAPYHVLTDTCASKVHRLFRTMGLRHLVVTSELNEVEGIITRADLIRHSHTSADGYHAF